jgi:hypothetical protein
VVRADALAQERVSDDIWVDDLPDHRALLKAYLVDARRRAIGVSTDTEEALLRTSHLFQVSLSTLSPSPLIPTPSHTVHRAPYTVHHAPRTVHHAPRTVHHASCTVHHAPRTTHRALKGFL